MYVYRPRFPILPSYPYRHYNEALDMILDIERMEETPSDDRHSSTRTPKPETLNPKPQTLNPKPQTPNPKP